MIDQLIEFIRETYRTKDQISLHSPQFQQNDISSVTQTLTSTFVSSVAPATTEFETLLSKNVGENISAIATVNGTSALHAALHTAGVQRGDLVITQPLSFAGTVNAILYTGAEPLFVDISESSLSLCPERLKSFFDEEVIFYGQELPVHKKSGRTIRACVPVNTFGHPCEIDKIKKTCSSYNVKVIEDAAASLGSKFREQSTAQFSDLSITSFNGNKIITTGGGGAIFCAHSVKEGILTTVTTSRTPHPWLIAHDQLGYNYRMPGLNASLGTPQLLRLDKIVQAKRVLAHEYIKLGTLLSLNFFKEPKDCLSNYWLNVFMTNSRAERDTILKQLHSKGIQARAAWELLPSLEYVKSRCLVAVSGIETSEQIQPSLVCLPSSPPPYDL